MAGGVRLVVGLRARAFRGFVGVAAFTAAVISAANAGERNTGETSSASRDEIVPVVLAAYPIAAAVGVKLGA